MSTLRSSQQPTYKPYRSDLLLQSALSQAEHLAYQNQGNSAVVYVCQSMTPMSPDVAAGRASSSFLTFFVRLDSDPAPDDAQVVTSFKRIRPQGRPGTFGLKEIVHQVVANLPLGLSLAPNVVVEEFPPGYDGQRGIFAYQFMSADGRNVATWIPGVNSPTGAQMQIGYDGLGRPYTLSIQRQKDISNFIQQAKDVQAQSNEVQEAQGGVHDQPRG